MAIETTIEISGTKEDGRGGEITIGPHTLTNTDGPEARTTQAFAANTFEAVAVPEQIGTAAIRGVVIIPPTDNSGAITLKGVTGDTGIDLHKTKPTVLSLNSTTNLGLLCASAITLTFDWF
jgi:hypothetical protein